VVLYQENLDSNLLDIATKYIKQANVLVVTGTSLTVHPEAGLIRNYDGDKFLLINKSPTPIDGLANFLISDSISKVLSALIAE
jgi:NAD-dependent deacetylase